MVAPRPRSDLCIQMALSLPPAGMTPASVTPMPEPGDEHAEEAAGQAGRRRGRAPADAGRRHDLAGTELVDQEAHRDLHQGVGPEEGREQEAHELGR